jgi:hypothetical protein
MNMRFQVLAVDYDGTLALDGSVRDLTILALRLVRTPATGECASTWSASGLPALWIGLCHRSQIREGQ